MHISKEASTPLAHAIVEVEKNKILLHVQFEWLVHILMESSSEQRGQQDQWSVPKELVSRKAGEENF